MASKTFNAATIARLLSHEDEHGMGRVFMYTFLNEVIRQKRPFPFDCESAQISPNLMIVDNQGRSIVVEYMRNRLGLTLNDQRTETPALIEYKGEAYRQIILDWLAACIRYTSLQPELRKELTGYAQSIQKRVWLTTSVGHRVKSQRGMQFRQWVNRHIRHNICGSFPF